MFTRTWRAGESPLFRAVSPSGRLTQQPQDSEGKEEPGFSLPGRERVAASGTSMEGLDALGTLTSAIPSLIIFTA